MRLGHLLLGATAPAGGGSALSASYLQVASSGSNATAYTFASQNLGAAASDRSILVVGISRAAGSTPYTASSVTVAGVSATIDAQVSLAATNQTNVVIAHAAVPTGATGDVVISWSGTMLRHACALYRVTGGGLVVTDSATGGVSSGTSTSAGTLTTVADGVLIAGWGYGAGASDQATWTGATEDFDIQVASESLAASGAHAATDGSSVAVSVLHATAIFETAIAAVTYQGA